MYHGCRRKLAFDGLRQVKQNKRHLAETETESWESSNEVFRQKSFVICTCFILLKKSETIKVIIYMCCIQLSLEEHVTVQPLHTKI
jgi:hypothetical protein